MSDTFDGSVGTPEAAPVEAPVSAPATGTPAPSAAPQSEFEIKWNGQTQRVPIDRARELAQMGYDYTQKMQKLAEERRTWEGERTQYQQAIDEIRTFLEDRARIEQYMKQRWADAQQQQAADPDQPLTRQEYEQRIAQERQALAQQQQQSLAQLRAQFEVDQLASQYTTDLEAHIKGLSDAMPELRAIPQLARVLKEEVAAMKPGSLEEAKSYMREVARRHAERVQGLLLEERKKAATPNPALANGIEPPGGSGPMPPATPAYKGKFSDPQWKSLVEQDLQRMLANSAQK